jgi:hypothetical protein
MQQSDSSNGTERRPHRGSWVWSPFSFMRRMADEMDRLADRMGLSMGLDPGVGRSGRQRRMRSYSGQRH